MSYTSNHHIPQYYLSGFASSPASDRVWVYEKGSDHVFNPNLTNVATENHRWPKETEEYLTQQIENPANPILDKIRHRQLLTTDDKDKISAYIVVMWRRVDEGLLRTKAIMPEVSADLFRQFRDEISKRVKENPSKADTFQNSLNELTRLENKYKTEFPREFWYKTITAESSLQLKLFLTAMTWVLFTCGNGQQPFLTCDNPVYYFHDIGIGKPQSEITFPISSTTALWATWRIDLEEGYLSAQEAAIKEINRRTVVNATRYVYYSRNSPWVVTLVNRKPTDITLHRLV